VITYVYRINWLVLITEECVYCAVLTESLNIIRFTLRFLRVKRETL
jgi:hypothetical protein